MCGCDCDYDVAVFTDLTRALAFFVLVSCARLSSSHSAFESTLNYCIVSNRIASYVVIGDYDMWYTV